MKKYLETDKMYFGTRIYTLKTRFCILELASVLLPGYYILYLDCILQTKKPENCNFLTLKSCIYEHIRISICCIKCIRLLFILSTVKLLRYSANEFVTNAASQRSLIFLLNKQQPSTLKGKENIYKTALMIFLLLRNMSRNNDTSLRKN